MDFDLTEEQSMLKDSLNRLLADTYGFEQRRRHMAAPEGWSGEMWGRYAEMGLMALPFDEADGGLGGLDRGDHDRDGGDGPGAGAGALFPDRGAGRSHAALRAPARTSAPNTCRRSQTAR